MACWDKIGIYFPSLGNSVFLYFLIEVRRRRFSDLEPPAFPLCNGISMGAALAPGQVGDKPTTRKKSKTVGIVPFKSQLQNVNSSR